MGCIKNIYSLFGATGPNLDLEADKIYYLGWSSSYGYPGSYSDPPAPSAPYDFLQVSINGQGFQDLTQYQFGLPVEIPNTNYEGILLSVNGTVQVDVGEICTSINTPGTAAVNGFYYFLREVATESCTTFSAVAALEVKDGIHLPPDVTIVGVCNTDAGIDCYDLEQHVDPAVTGLCMSPPYNTAFWSVDSPSCVDLSAGGTFTFTYTVPSEALTTVLPLDPECQNCTPDDLVINITVIVGPEYQGTSVVMCNT